MKLLFCFAWNFQCKSNIIKRNQANASQQAQSTAGCRETSSIEKEGTIASKYSICPAGARLAWNRLRVSMWSAWWNSRVINACRRWESDEDGESGEKAAHKYCSMARGVWIDEMHIRLKYDIFQSGADKSSEIFFIGGYGMSRWIFNERC
jgi:hypothetical protein